MLQLFFISILTRLIILWELSWKRRQKHCKSQRRWRTSKKHDLLNTAGMKHILTSRPSGSIRRDFRGLGHIGSSAIRLYGTSLQPKQRSYLKLITTHKGKIMFFFQQFHLVYTLLLRGGLWPAVDCQHKINLMVFLEVLFFHNDLSRHYLLPYLVFAYILWFLVFRF